MFCISRPLLVSQLFNFIFWFSPVWNKFFIYTKFSGSDTVVIFLGMFNNIYVFGVIYKVNALQIKQTYGLKQKELKA